MQTNMKGVLFPLAALALLIEAANISKDSSIRQVIDRLESVKGILSLAYEHHLGSIDGLRQEVRSLPDTISADVTRLSNQYTHSLLISKVELKMSVSPLMEVLEWMADNTKRLDCLVEAEKSLKSSIEAVVRLEGLTRETLESYENERASFGIESKEHLLASVHRFVTELGKEDETMIETVSESVHILRRCENA